MKRKRVWLASALAAMAAALAIGVPLVDASSATEQPAQPGQQGDVQRASEPSGGGGELAPAATPSTTP
jgi:hypothetical protein